jgi:zinc-ribbon family/Short C-terminal domain
MLIFGWGRSKAKDRGEVAPLSCPNCHNTVFLHDIESKQQFSLYFVPVVKYGGDRYLLCPVCGQGLQVLPTQRAAVDRMRALTGQFRLRGVTEDTYRSEVGRFWQQLGVRTGPALAGSSSAPALRGVPPGLGMTPAPPQLAPPVPPLPVALVSPDTATPPLQPSPAGAELAGHLADLARLRAEGSLTDEEFAEAKRRLLEI